MRNQGRSANQFFSYRLGVIADRFPELVAEGHDLFVAARSHDTRAQLPDLIFGCHRSLRTGRTRILDHAGTLSHTELSLFPSGKTSRSTPG
jgi:hypothetical protein